MRSEYAKRNNKIIKSVTKSPALKNKLETREALDVLNSHMSGDGVPS